MGSMLNIPSRMEGPEQKTIIGKPEITVSARGIANGRSVYLNDGADFGPDTKLGATTLGQYGPPYTTTDGIQEMFDFAFNNGVIDAGTGLRKWLPMKFIERNTFNISSSIISKNDTSHVSQITLDATGCLVFSNGNIFAFDLSGTPQIDSQIVFPKIYNASGTSNTNGAIRLAQITQSNIVFQQIQNYTATNASAITIDQTISGLTQGFFNNLLQIKMINYAFTALNVKVLAHATSPLGFGGNSVFVNQIINGNGNQIVINSTNATAGNAGSNTFYNCIIEGLSTGNYAILDNDGSNTYIINVVEEPINVTSNASSYSLFVMPNTSGYTNVTGKCKIISGNPQGFGITTPALPTGTGSTNAVTNTFPFSVRVFQTGESGTHIVDNAGNDVLLPSNPNELTLEPGNKIYYATTVATSWKWYGC